MAFSSTSASKPSTDRLLKCLCISVSGPCKTEVIISTPQEALIEKHAVIIKMAKTKGKKTTQKPLPGFGSEQAGCSLLWKAAPAPRRSEHSVLPTEHWSGPRPFTSPGHTWCNQWPYKQQHLPGDSQKRSQSSWRLNMSTKSTSSELKWFGAVQTMHICLPCF